MPTYYLQQPMALDSLAMDKLAIWIVSQANNFFIPAWKLQRLDDPNKADDALSRQIEMIRNYFYSKLPGKFYDPLLFKIMTQLVPMIEKNYSNIKDDQTKASGRIVETLLTEDLTSILLNYTYSSTIYYNNSVLYEVLIDSIRSKSLMLSGLTELRFHGIYLTSKESELISLLENLHSLKYLSIPQVGTDNILKCIEHNCILIEELDVRDSREINDKSVEIMTRLNHLKSVNLEQTPVTGVSIEMLLLSCKNIEQIAISTYYPGRPMTATPVSLPYVLKQIRDSKETFPKHFKITNYAIINDSFEELEVLGLMCPYIRNLSLHRNNKVNIQALAKFRSLRELSFSIYDYYDDEIKIMLETVGLNLESLSFSVVNQLDLSALNDISQLCPNLTHLSIIYCDIQSTSLNTEELNIQPFKHLKNVSLDLRALESPPPRNVLGTPATIQLTSTSTLLGEKMVFCILSNCLNVEFIELYGESCLTEDLLMQIFDRNPFTYLKKIKVHIHNDNILKIFTPSIVERITQNCINRPQVMSGY